MTASDPNENADSASEQITFSLTINLDREDFFRRACPSCGLEFKTEGNPADFSWALESELRHASQEVDVEVPNVAGDDSPMEILRCPYCGHENDAKEMHTEETHSYLRLIAMREYALPRLHQMLLEFTNSLNQLGGGSGLVSLSIKSDYQAPPLPQRPFYGPDIPDMIILKFLCCGKRLKVLEGWSDVNQCSYCATQVKVI